MNKSINDIIAKMQSLQSGQDGTMKGGFVSASGGRYRIVIDSNPQASEAGQPGDPVIPGGGWPPLVVGNPNCSNQFGCVNDKCGDSTNDMWCSNKTCISTNNDFFSDNIKLGNLK